MLLGSSTLFSPRENIITAFGAATAAPGTIQQPMRAPKINSRVYIIQQPCEYLPLPCNVEVVEVLGLVDVVVVAVVVLVVVATNVVACSYAAASCYLGAPMDSSGMAVAATALTQYRVAVVPRV